MEHFGAIAVAIALSALVAGRRLLPPDADDREPTPILARPQRSLLVLGAAAFFTLMAEGAAADWSAVYLSDSLGAGAAAAALGYTAFSLAMAASRVFGDRLNSRLGPVALARGGGLLAASALTLALVSGSTVVALAGFAAMGAGLGVVVPVLFRAAGSTPGVSAAAGVAAVSTIGWFGFLAGPPAIGVTADAIGLRSSSRSWSLRRSRLRSSRGARTRAAAGTSAASSSSRGQSCPTWTACSSTRGRPSNGRGGGSRSATGSIPRSSSRRATGGRRST